MQLERIYGGVNQKDLEDILHSLDKGDVVEVQANLFDPELSDVRIFTKSEKKKGDRNERS